MKISTVLVLVQNYTEIFHSSKTKIRKNGLM